MNVRIVYPLLFKTGVPYISRMIVISINAFEKLGREANLVAKVLREL